MSWSREKVLARLRELGVVPIIRVSTAEHASRAVEAVVAGGIAAVEITMGVPNALHVMEQVADRYGDSVLLGAGTVLDSETCRAALLAGAEFIVTPSLDVKVIETARRYSKACIPGALTPTEIVTAWQAGADMVKVFPCAPVGGPNYIRSLRGPLPQIDYVPTGGVDLETTPEYIRAGAAAVAVGGELVSNRALREGKTEVITANARNFLEAVRTARSEMQK
ncbi:MAG TPA: bifunctional 4-hydroxy-2-oxoglutarate aldolase/2-dehydro-3-deoxy-phosphogluconate aldolase [Terriglobia bacterium]|jgi:2-dehydro-3-deoxyphosphogluconate aldolase/(4S)-4-hydroxy-2-oxoglutarate aldolase|nr:bifunctional 4-hydroxy-2-oxoglutarate aldolase/2-dehydro-3-deoxy-phosphogluconate aldolase [Terriglobia bacterium]